MNVCLMFPGQGTQKPGMLCSVLGLDAETVGQVALSVDPTQEHLVVALCNTDNQIVLGGEPEYVEKAEVLCKEKGALRTVPIRVSNAFHTPLMKEMEEEFAAFIDAIPMSEPKCKLMLNCKGDFALDVADIKKELKNQRCHTVLWSDGVKKVIASTEDRQEGIPLCRP